MSVTFSVFRIVPNFFKHTQIIMSRTAEPFGVDGMMNIVENARLAGSPQIIFIKAAFIHMHIDDFQAHQNRIVPFGNFLFLP